MKFSLANILMALLCFSLGLGWYAAREKQFALANDLAEMNAERTQLVTAAILFGQKTSQIEPTEYEHEFPGPNSELTDKQFEQLTASETLILLMNLEKEMRKVIQLQTPSNEDGTDEFYYYANDLWTTAGQPEYDQLLKMSKISDSNLAITDPARLEELIEDFLKNIPN